MTATAPRPMPATEWALAELEPHEWIHVADYLDGQISRAPITGDGWAAERIVLGALAAELRSNAIAAGEPTVVDPEEEAAMERTIEAAAQAMVASGHARDEAFTRDAAAARRQAIYDELTELEQSQQQEEPPAAPEPAADLTWFDD